MSNKSIIGVLIAILVLLFSTGCGAGIVPQDPTLPWEVTQDPVVDLPLDETETVQATLTDEVSPESETATLPPTDIPTETATVTLPPDEDSSTPTLSLSATIPPITATPSQTPTQTQAVQVAPPDSNFNNPLNISLDSTASVTEFISFPGGDTIDRVRFDVTGMNSNASLSGGRARLILAVSCFGSGTQNITFFTNGETFSCGQTIVDREITFDSRTGSVTIEAIGGQNTYVQWVLTGTATRTN